MPNVNLTDSRTRDAVVKAETTGVAEEVRYVDQDGQTASTRRILKATVDHDYDTLLARHSGDPEALAQALIKDDPEVDIEKFGLYLWGVSKVYVNSSDGVVYRIEQQEVVRGADGKVRETRARERSEANVDSEIPLTWTGRKFPKAEAVRRFVFASKLQIVHINGLTYDFLFGMAKELADSNALMMVGGGEKGRDPLVFRSGSVPYRGFLEGRVEGDKYILLLHLSNLELKLPEADKDQDEDSKEKDTKAPAKAEKEDQKASKKTTKAETTKTPVEGEPGKSKKKAASKKKAKLDEAKPDKGKNDKAEKPKTAKTGAEKEVTQSKAASASEDIKTGPGFTSSEDLGIWLKSIRMGKYLSLFVENEIDVDVLSELSDEDLKDLDIPLGSRRRLLKAVEETDNLHAEVAMAVSAMSGKKSTKKKSTKAK